MKRYRVWVADGCYIDIEARRVQMLISTNNDQPLKIRFVDDNDYILAEFYCDRISGWAEIKCLVGSKLNQKRRIKNDKTRRK